MISLKERVNRSVKIASKDWPTYDGGYLDRSKYLSASEASNCERMLWFAKRHPEKVRGPLETWGYAERGNAYESWVVDRINSTLDLDETLLFAGSDQLSFYSDEHRISGTPDGFLVNQEKKSGTVLEFKSFDPRKSVANLPDPKHVAQININMALLQLIRPVNADVDDEHGGILSYGNASNFQDHYEFPLKFDGTYFAKAKIKADRIFTKNNPADTEPEGLLNGDCRFCPFTEECSKLIGKPIDEAEREIVQPMEMPEIKANPIPRGMKGKIRRFVENNQKIKDLKKENKELDKDVRAYVMEHGGEVTLGSATVTVSEQAGRETVDKVRLRNHLDAIGMDLDDYIETGKPFSRMDVKFAK